MRHTAIRSPVFERYEGVPAETDTLRPNGDFIADASKCVFPRRKIATVQILTASGNYIPEV